MPDDEKLPSEAEKITNEIRQAMSAYSELQITLADAARPLPEQFASIMTASDASLQLFQVEMQATAEAQSRWAKEIQDAQRQLQETFANTTSIWVDAHHALAKEMSEAGPRLRQILKQVDHIGRLGWTVTMDMTFPEMQQLSSMASPAEADAYMLAWYEDYDSDLSSTEKRIKEVRELQQFQLVLAQCFTAWRHGDYAVTLPCLLAVLERGIRTLGPTTNVFSTKVQKMMEKLYDKAKQDAPGSIEASVWMSLYAFVQWLYEQYGSAKATQTRLFRHGIQHGTQPPPNERVEALRLIHALDTVTALYPDQCPLPST